MRLNLCEALDGDGRPLCLMPAPELARQNLRRREAAACLHDGRGRLALRRGDAGFGFFVHAPVPAGYAAEDFCRLSLTFLGAVPRLRPCGRSGLVHYFGGRLAPWQTAGLEADAVNYLFLAPEELPALAEFVDPLLLAAADFLSGVFCA